MSDRLDAAHMKNMTQQTPATPSDRHAPVAWERRPDGGRYFTPGKRHLYDAAIDLDEAPSLRTLCGTEVPQDVLRELRTGRRSGAYAIVSLMTDRDIANAAPCSRCERAAAKD